MNLLPAELIKKKRNGGQLSEQEIQDFIAAYTAGSLPDYQMSALLMAVFFRGMEKEETLALTKAMLHSGVVVDLKNITGKKIDKHSTGGVGDKTSLILGPIVAAAGVPVPMISGRGLGHTGGTLDKLESIPGFNTQLDLQSFSQFVEKYKICFIGQTQEICPADKKIYALRDVTATVESLPLICASIMSKKLAEGIDGLVLDVKYGTGAFMKTAAKAEELALALMAIAKGYNKSVVALLTDMNQPLGRYAGNSVEVEECLDILQGKQSVGLNGKDLSADTLELSLWLSAHMIHLGGAAKNAQEAYEKAKHILASGQAYEKFAEICSAQRGRLEQLPRPKQRLEVYPTQDGYLAGFDTEKIGVAGIMIGAGRAKTSDLIAPTSGIEFHAKIGDLVETKKPIFSLLGDNLEQLKTATATLQSSVHISLQKTAPPSLILKTMT